MSHGRGPRDRYSHDSVDEDAVHGVLDVEDLGGNAPVRHEGRCHQAHTHQGVVTTALPARVAGQGSGQLSGDMWGGNMWRGDMWCNRWNDMRWDGM